MIDGLEAFLLVATAGSFSRVARDRGVAVSSVTRAIDRLEADLGARLLHLSPRRLALTDPGSHLLPRARRIVWDVREARAGVGGLGADPRGVLTVTAPTMFGRLHVAPTIPSFLQRQPLVEGELSLSDAVVDLTERRVDIAIRIGTLPSSDFVALRFAPVIRLACAAPAYLDRRGRSASPADLVDHDCLTLADRPLPSGWWRLAGVNRVQPLAIRGRFRSDDTGALLRAAVAGLGVVHLARWLVAENLAAGRPVALFRPEPRTAPRPPSTPYGCRAAPTPPRRAPSPPTCATPSARRLDGTGIVGSAVHIARRSQLAHRRASDLMNQPQEFRVMLLPQLGSDQATWIPHGS